MLPMTAQWIEAIRHIVVFDFELAVGLPGLTRNGVVVDGRFLVEGGIQHAVIRSCNHVIS